MNSAGGVSVFHDLCMACTYPLRKPSKRELRIIHASSVARLHPIDEDSPVGMNDTIRVACYFSGGEILYAAVA